MGASLISSSALAPPWSNSTVNCGAIWKRGLNLKPNVVSIQRTVGEGEGTAVRHTPMKIGAADVSPWIKTGSLQFR